MLRCAKSWSVFVMTSLLTLLLLCAAAVYAIDPFEQYRESSILPLYDQESYNNPGIVKNYDYDAVIIGTSMVEMSRPSVIDAAFGVRSVKLPMRGSHTAQMGWQLAHALDARDVRLAILAVDAYSLMGPPDDREEIVDYLWNGNPLDDVHYLLNRDVLAVRIPRMLKNKGKPLDGKRDSMYQWTDVTFSAQSVYDTISVMAQEEMTDAEYRIERSTENLERHIAAHVQAHPETEFYIYMPPYSVAYWYQITRLGLSEQQFRSRERVCELLLQYPNVKIFDYSCREEWVTNLDHYFDYSHHSSEISDSIMHAMAAGENRVLSAEDMREGSGRIRRMTEAFAAAYERR